MKLLVTSILLTFLFLASFSAWGDYDCQPHNELLTAPAGTKVTNCLHKTWFALGRSERIDRPFTIKFLKTLLPTSAADLNNLSRIEEFDVDYSKIAEVINLLDSKKLLKRYIDFIIFTSASADETRSFGLGKLYTLKTPMFLEVLSIYQSNSQQTVINSLAWGLSNNFYPNINETNYKRLIVGANWEILNKQYKYSELVNNIEIAVHQIIKK